MDREQFWSLMESVSHKGGECESIAERLIAALSKMEPKEIVDFQHILDELMTLSYRSELWAAAYIMNGGCSDDCFDYFRGWLIAQGREVFENALQNPETLVEVVDDASPEEPAFWCEDILYVATEAYEDKTGQEIPRRHSGELELVGEPWEEEEVYELYPLLAEKFDV